MLIFLVRVLMLVLVRVRMRVRYSIVRVLVSVLMLVLVLVRLSRVVVSIVVVLVLVLGASVVQAVVLVIVVLVSSIVVVTRVLVMILQRVDNAKGVVLEHALDARNVELEAELASGSVGKLANDNMATRSNVFERIGKHGGTQCNVDVMENEGQQQNVDKLLVALENLVQLGRVGSCQKHGTHRIRQFRRIDARLKVGDWRRRNIDAHGTGEDIESRVTVGNERKHVDAVSTAVVEQR